MAEAWLNESQTLASAARAAAPAVGVTYSNVFDVTRCTWLEFAINIAATPGGTNPTLDILFETSIDGINYTTLTTAFTQITTSASAQRKATHRYLATPLLLGHWGRFKITVAADSGTPAYSGTVYLSGGH